MGPRRRAKRAAPGWLENRSVLDMTMKAREVAENAASAIGLCAANGCRVGIVIGVMEKHPARISFAWIVTWLRLLGVAFMEAKRRVQDGLGRVLGMRVQLIEEAEITASPQLAIPTKDCALANAVRIKGLSGPEESRPQFLTCSARTSLWWIGRGL